MCTSIVSLVLPCVIGVLLIVRSELQSEKREHSERKDAVGSRQGCRVRRGNQRRGSNEKQKDILDRS